MRSNGSESELVICLAVQVLLASRSVVQNHNMLLGCLWKLCGQLRSNWSSNWKGVGRRKEFLTDFADQRKLDCTHLLSKGEGWNCCKKNKKEISCQKFRDSMRSAASCCLCSTKSLIFKMWFFFYSIGTKFSFKSMRVEQNLTSEKSWEYLYSFVNIMVRSVK